MPELIRVFFDSAALAIHDLAAESGFRREAILEAFTPSGMMRVPVEEIAGSFFLADTAFETSRLVGNITYGDREFYINMVVSPRIPNTDGPLYGLWEWASAFDVRDERAGGGQFALSTERVRTVVGGLGAVFTEIWPRIADAGPSVFEAMDEARAKVRAAYSAAEARLDHERIVARATEAFRARDYVRTIELLERVRDRLTPAEQARLQLAKRYASTSRPAT